MFIKSEDITAYSDISKTLWTFEKRQAERFHSKSFSKSMNIWNQGKFNQGWKVGNMLEFLNKTQPATRSDFAKQYLNEIRTPSQVIKMVAEFAGRAGLTNELALNWWWIRVIDMSFTGWHEEGLIMDLLRIQLQGTGNDVRSVTDAEDRDYGVDAVVFNIATNAPVEGLQFKPASYFLGTFASNVEAREVTNPEKFKKFKAVYGVDVRYVHIDDSLRYGYPVFQTTHRSFKTANRFAPLNK